MKNILIGIIIGAIVIIGASNIVGYFSHNHMQELWTEYRAEQIIKNADHVTHYTEDGKEITIYSQRVEP